MVRTSDHALDVRVRPARIPDDLDEICALYTQEAEFHAAQWPADFRKRDVTSSVRKEFAQAGDNQHLLLIVAEVGDGSLGGVLSAYLRPKPEQGMARHDGPITMRRDLT